MRCFPCGVSCQICRLACYCTVSRHALPVDTATICEGNNHAYYNDFVCEASPFDGTILFFVGLQRVPPSEFSFSGRALMAPLNHAHVLVNFVSCFSSFDMCGITFFCRHTKRQAIHRQHNSYVQGRLIYNFIG